MGIARMARSRSGSRVQGPGIAEGFDLVGKRAARFRLVDGVITAVAVERRIEVYQVHAGQLELVADDGKAVAIKQAIFHEAKQPRKNRSKPLPSCRWLYFQQASAMNSGIQRRPYWWWEPYQARLIRLQKPSMVLV